MSSKNNSGNASNIPESIMSARPLSRAEMHEAAKKRISLISKEFSDGFEFLEDFPKSVSFFGSSRLTPEQPYYQKALSLAKKIVNELGYSIITGGGPGIMEAANRGAFEEHGQSAGITIKLPKEQTTNSYLTAEMPLYYFFIRKVCLSFSAEAFVFFPGGFGTLDELMELLTLVQTNKIQSVPIILYGSEYWNQFETFLRQTPLAYGMINESDFDLFTIVDDENTIIEIIKNAPLRLGVDYPNDN